MTVRQEAVRASRAIDADDPLPPIDDLPAAFPQASLDEIYRATRPGLLRYLRKQSSNDDAQDIAHQAFARFAGAMAKAGAAIANPAAYLQRSVRNLLLDQVKLAERHGEARHAPYEELRLAGADQIAALEARDMLRRFEAALLKLKPLTREVFLAHRLDGYSYAEIAQRTGLSAKAVEHRMSQAIAHLDRVLGALR